MLSRVRSGVGGRATVREGTWETERRAESAAAIAKLNLPAAAGVPEIVFVEALRFRRSGSGGGEVGVVRRLKWAAGQPRGSGDGQGGSHRESELLRGAGGVRIHHQGRKGEGAAGGWGAIDLTVGVERQAGREGSGGHGPDVRG